MLMSGSQQTPSLTQSKCIINGEVEEWKVLLSDQKVARLLCDAPPPPGHWLELPRLGGGGSE